MGFIDDGKGTGYKAAVSKKNQLKVLSATEPQMTHSSKYADSFSWTAISADIDTGDTALWVTNTSTSRLLHITQIYMWADTAVQFKMHCPAYPTTPAGTAIVGNNLNRTSSKLADALAYADETANAFVAANVIYTVRNNEVGTDQFGVMVDLNGALILGYHQAIAVDIIGETAAFECTIMGYFEEEEA